MAKRQSIPPKLRHEVFRRDGYRCRECGATNKETTLEIDHIVPVSKGGGNNLSNLQTLCKACNRAKHTRTWVGGSQHYTQSKGTRYLNGPYYAKYFNSKSDGISKDFQKKEFSNQEQLFTSKTFIDVLTSEGIFLSCSIPYFLLSNGKIIINGSNIERYKKVKMIESGIYIEDILRGMTLRIYWTHIRVVKTNKNILTIELNNTKRILIRLPDDLNVYEDIRKIILEKISFAEKHKDICPNCNNHIDDANKNCEKCGFNFLRINYDIAINDYNTNPSNNSLKYEKFFNSKEFISNITENGIVLSCFIPNYIRDEKGNIKIKDNTIVNVSKKVKIQTDGIYIKNIFPDKTIKMLWNDISNIKISSNRLKITKDEKNIIIINLPKDIDVIEDVKQLILNKTTLEDVREKNIISNKVNLDNRRDNTFGSKIKKWFKR